MSTLSEIQLVDEDNQIPRRQTMLTTEYYDVVINNEVYKTKLRTWDKMRKHLLESHGPYKLVPVDHPKDPRAVLVENSNGIPVGYLPQPDPQDLRGRIREALRKNEDAIFRMSQDTKAPEQMEWEL